MELNDKQFIELIELSIFINFVLIQKWQITLKTDKTLKKKSSLNN